MRLFANANYKFLEIRYYTYALSAAVIGLGLISILLHGGFTYGVDFAGGTLFQVEFHKPVAAADIRAALGSAGVPNVEVQDFGSANEFLIRTAEFLEGHPELANRVQQTLSNRFGAEGFTIVRVEAVGPKVGEELRARAIGAVLISFVLTLVYLAFRFEWRFGLAAVIATAHDILIVFGAISLLGVEISLTAVAAVLTIIGYSLNDTIVVFDRIRENLKKQRRLTYMELLNLSINETLPRTVMTGSATVAVLFSLLFFGGPVIRQFIIILIIGIFVGTFSSIFVGSPVLLEIELRSGGKRSKTDRRKIAVAPR
jgi:preprotein translocase subunit SecF